MTMIEKAASVELVKEWGFWVVKLNGVALADYRGKAHAEEFVTRLRTALSAKP